MNGRSIGTKIELAVVETSGVERPTDQARDTPSGPLSNGIVTAFRSRF